MKNKKVKTFADRAKEIQKRYPRAEWDKIEHKDMLKELASLKDEQEEYRSMFSDNMGDNVQAEGVNETPLAAGGINLPNTNSYTWDKYKGFNQLQNKYSNINNMFVPLISTFNTKAASSTYRPLSTSILPTAVSAISSLLGSASSLKRFRETMPKEVSLPRVTTQDISLEPERQALKREYNTATNVALRNSRGFNPANAYSNMIAGVSGLTDSLGTKLGQSYMNEEVTNTNAENQANMYNAQIGGQEAMANMQLQQQNAAGELQYINSLYDTIPMALRDYREQVNQNNMLSILGKDYGLYEQYNPYLKGLQRLKQNVFPRFAILNRLNSNIKQ